MFQPVLATDGNSVCHSRGGVVVGLEGVVHLLPYRPMFFIK